MPRFFFDIHDGTTFVDDEGTDYPDIHAMRREALRAAGGMLGEKTETWTGDPWTMTVRDEGQAVVATLTFSAHSG